MAKIAIVGAGRIGIALAKILLSTTDNEIFFIDSDQRSLDNAVDLCVHLQRPQHRMAFSPEVQVSSFKALNFLQIEDRLKNIKPNIIVCATTFGVQIAKIAADLKSHYLDFTEDVESSALIYSMDVDSIFVPQTGLAPGLVSYIGLSLFEELLTPKSLNLRVGALPQISFGPEHYGITWSPEGLINEYLKPTIYKENDQLFVAESLSGLESMIIHGVAYEGFRTSGGLGSPEAYAGIPSVEYKTIRYPGHSVFMKNILMSVQYDFDKAVSLVKEIFPKIKDDVVVLMAQATDIDNNMLSTSFCFYPNFDLDLTALELTTAGTAAGIIELMLNDDLDVGVLEADQIPFDILMKTEALKLVFENVQ